jgi:methyl-accepting chemotaxis protein
MVSHLELVVFTIVPLLVLGATIVYCSIRVYSLNDKRPVLLIALLTVMSLHQLTEVVRFTAGVYSQTTSVPSEVFETAADLLASAASYFVVQQLTDLQAAQSELESTNTALEERSSMVAVLNRILRHNVRNDVNLIAGHAANIRRRETDGEFREELQTIEETALDLAKISDRTQRINQLLTEDPTATTELRLSECLDEPLRDAARATPNATISLHRGDTENVTIEAPSTFPIAVADVVEQIADSSRGDVNIDITLTRGQATDGQESRPVVLVIDDDGDGLPDVDIDAIETDEETPLRHATGLSLWCLKWAVKRAGGTLDANPGDATLEIQIPEASQRDSTTADH